MRIITNFARGEYIPRIIEFETTALPTRRYKKPAIRRRHEINMPGCSSDPSAGQIDHVHDATGFESDGVPTWHKAKIRTRLPRDRIILPLETNCLRKTWREVGLSASSYTVAREPLISRRNKIATRVPRPPEPVCEQGLVCSRTLEAKDGIPQ